MFLCLMVRYFDNGDLHILSFYYIESTLSVPVAIKGYREKGIQYQNIPGTYMTIIVKY